MALFMRLNYGDLYCILPVLSCLITTIYGLNLGQCIVEPLGMETGKIIDEQIKASSCFDEQSVGPQNARIRTEKGSGAWCPKSQIRNNSYEYLQINLNSSYIITGIETQGRYGNGTGVEYTNNYYIDYFRSGGSWIRYKNRDKTLLMKGNNDTITSIYNELDPPIIASKIRIVLHSEHPRTMCLRVELYGCKDYDYIDGYSISNDGFKLFKDDIFENTHEIDTIIGANKGIGLLYDGYISNINPNSTNNSSYIGWNKNFTKDEIIIIFQFNTIKNFTDIEFYGWGKPFNIIYIDFSIDGNIFNPHESILTTYPKDFIYNNDINDQSYSLTIPLSNRHGKFIRFRIKFDDLWLYLTEINFNQALFEGTMDNNVNEGSFNIWYYVIVFILVLLIIFFFVILFIIYLMKKRYNKNKKITTNKNGIYKTNLLVTTLGCDGTTKNILQPSTKLLAQFNSNNYYPTMNNDNKKILTNSSRSCSSNTMNKDTPPSLLDINFPPPPPSTDSSELDNDTNLTTLLINNATSSCNNTPQKRRKNLSMTRRNKTLPNRPSVVDEEGIISLSTNPNNIDDESHLNPIVNISSKNIQLIEQIGEGKFTNIYKCKVNDINELSVIKMIKHNVDDYNSALKALYCEYQILSKINHLNIIKLYGISEDNSIIMEYLPFSCMRTFINNEKNKLNFPSLLHFCNNIANAMKYLEQRNIVHGHLSPRNCLIDNNFNVKISGPRGPLHHAQLRYSAPECIILNEWTHKSDAWSFGVTVWEILHYCERIPFEKLTNQDIVDNSKNLINGVQPNINGKLEFFDECCPLEIRDIINECFDPNPETRPAFLELQLFLSRKSMSFTLQHKRQRPVGLMLPQSVSMYR